MNIEIRPARPTDATAAGAICHSAFQAIANAHGFPPDFPSPEVASQVLGELMSDPHVAGWVAQAEGRIVGSNFASAIGGIAGIGPITVAPDAQNAGVGRHLMRASMEHAQRLGCAGIRLVQAGYHTRSLSLYSKLGFVPREPLAVMQGQPLKRVFPGHEVRKASVEDAGAADEICRRVHGISRRDEFLRAVSQGNASVAVRGGRVVGYATQIAFFGHAVGENDEAIQALILAAGAFAGPGFLVPIRHASLFRWCLGQGLRVVQPMTLMTTGLYNEPQGGYLPSVLF